MPEARLDDSGSGLAPAGDGWFVVNVRDAQWLTWETASRGSVCSFESPEFEFTQLGIGLHVLEPGEPTGLYHSESQQEAFLVLSGECRLLVEGEERLLRPWDFFHSPAGTEHIFVGAGDGPCVILMTGARSDDMEVLYPVSELAARYGASVEEETSDPEQAYARFEPAGGSDPRTGTVSPGPSPNSYWRSRGSEIYEAPGNARMSRRFGISPEGTAKRLARWHA